MATPKTNQTDMDHDYCREYKLLSTAAEGENSVKKWRGSSLKASNTFVNILRHFSLCNRENLAFDARKEMKDEPATKFPAAVDDVCVPWPSLSRTERKSPASVTAAIPPTAAA